MDIEETSPGLAQSVFSLMQKEVADWCKEKGWADDGRTFGDEIALLHSELSEALEAFRVHGFKRVFADPATFPYSEVLELPEGKPYPKYNDGINDGKMVSVKPEGVPSELADVLVRLLDTCERHNINLYQEWRSKMSYNWQRTYRHGNKAL